MENNELNESVPENENAEPLKMEAPVESLPIIESEHEEQVEVEVEQQENYSQLSKEELVKKIDEFLAEEDYNSIKSKVNLLKDAFNELVAHEREQQLEKYLETGGEKENFEYKQDDLEVHFNKALRKINRRRAEFIESQEKQRELNLASKQEILQQMKDLIQNEENMAKAFHSFHELQNKWRATGAVPGKNVNDLWMTYKLYIDKFYDLIKINRELQDLDQRKNLEIKINICEQAEDLIMEPSLNKALNKLNVLQNHWKAIGPVLREKRTEIGERYKKAADKVFERKHEYLEQLKVKQAESLAAKTALCEQAEQIIISEQPSHNELQEKTKQFLELFAAWRKSGHAEKTVNDELWKRFRALFDNFFKQKQDFYHKKRKEFQANLQAKTELCIQAEALQNNTDWRSAAAEYRKLSDEWKKIGPVGAKMSDKIWHRFKAACDVFFKNRKEHFADADKDFEENYSKKTQLIERIEKFTLGENREENFNQLKDFQREWMEIGLVPLAKKDEIYNRYKKLIDALFNGLRLDEREKRDMRFKGKGSFFKSTNGTKDKVPDEKKALMSKISQLNSEVTVWENNLGFFAKSKSADQIKKDFEIKINKAKEEIADLKKQLEVIKTF